MKKAIKIKYKQVVRLLSGENCWTIVLFSLLFNFKNKSINLKKNKNIVFNFLIYLLHNN